MDEADRGRARDRNYLCDHLCDHRGATIPLSHALTLLALTAVLVLVLGQFR